MPLPARINNHMALVTPRKPPQMHPSWRRWIPTVGSDRTAWLSRHRVPPQKTRFLPNTAAIRWVLFPVDDSSISMNDISEATDRIAWRAQLWVPHQVFWWVMDLRPFNLLAGEKTLDLLPWRRGLLLLLLSLPFGWWLVVFLGCWCCG